MASISDIKRIIVEDFPSADQAMIQKLAFILKPFLDDVVAAFDGDITVDNLTRQYASCTIKTVASSTSYLVNNISTGGTISPIVKVKNNLVNPLVGINVINVNNATNPASYPLGAVGITWTVNTNIITITSVTGLPDGQAFNLTLELIS
jgi:hypothetical protein